MKFTHFTSAALIGSAAAYPGMKATFEDIHYIAKRYIVNDLYKRQGNLTAPPPNREMIGDLLTKGATTPQGQVIQHCMIFGLDDCQDLTPRTYLPPGPLGSDLCAKDTCCVWNSVALDLIDLFTADDGTHGIELWSTNGVDGTAANTSLLTDINPNGDGMNGVNTAFYTNNSIYFSASDGSTGTPPATDAPNSSWHPLRAASCRRSVPCRAMSCLFEFYPSSLCRHS